MGGSRLVRARTAVDLPVPLRPQMRTPPIDGSMALSIRASLMFCCPTIALNGNVAMFVLSSLPICDGSGTHRYIFPHHQIQGYCMLSHGCVTCQKSRLNPPFASLSCLYDCHSRLSFIPS